jgi:RNA polymerase sigma-70 factor (ECF subfamily)
MPKIIEIPDRKNGPGVRYSGRGERMAAGNGLGLALAAEGAEGDTAKSEDVGAAELHELFLELRTPICRYLISLGLDRNEAEDAAQESFLRLCQRGIKNDAGENVRGWMFRVAHNLARDEQRRRKRRPAEQLEDGEGFVVEQKETRPTPEQHLLEREQDARLKWAMAQLPEEQRRCLHLRAEGLKYREIGEVLEASTSTIAEWVQKGLKQLERDLA